MLTITLLGTAATMPLPDRALTAALAECGGHALLFDCGEGTQAAARRAGVNLMKLDAICLTHYHGDHIFGLPGLLQTLGCQGRERPLTLYGPEGLGEIWPALRTRAAAVSGQGCAAGHRPHRPDHPFLRLACGGAAYAFPHPAPGAQPGLPARPAPGGPL